MTVQSIAMIGLFRGKMLGKRLLLYLMMTSPGLSEGKDGSDCCSSFVHRFLDLMKPVCGHMVKAIRCMLSL